MRNSVCKHAHAWRFRRLRFHGDITMQPVMQAIKQTPTPSKGKLWTGRVLSGLVIAFLLMDTVRKLLKVQAAIDGTVELGYRESVLVPLGIVLLLCTLLYAIPRTAILGGVLLTGYLGGAVATHVRVADPLFT